MEFAEMLKQEHKVRHILFIHILVVPPEGQRHHEWHSIRPHSIVPR